jgi:hypothetical protein
VTTLTLASDLSGHPDVLVPLEWPEPGSTPPTCHEKLRTAAPAGAGARIHGAFREATPS